MTADHLRAREIITIVPLSIGDLAGRCRTLTPGVLSALGHPAGDLAWSTTSQDTFSTEWNGAQIGPSTETTHTASLPMGAGATIRVSINRWSEQDIANQQISASWRVGDQTLRVSGSTEAAAPIREIHLTGLPNLLAVLRRDLHEVPMRDGYLVRASVTGFSRVPYTVTRRCPSAAAVGAFLDECEGQRWRTPVDVRRADRPDDDGVTAEAWARGERP